MRIKGMRLHRRQARHARCPTTGQPCHTPYCELCGVERVEQVQGEVLRSHQPRPQP